MMDYKKEFIKFCVSGLTYANQERNKSAPHSYEMGFYRGTMLAFKQAIKMFSILFSKKRIHPL